MELGVVISAGAQRLLWPVRPRSLLQADSIRFLASIEAQLNELLAPSPAATKTTKPDPSEKRGQLLGRLTEHLALIPNAQVRHPSQR